MTSDTLPPATPTPQTRFDWLLYADATFAALALLIPIPYLDSLLETIFRRRMLKTIAWRNGRSDAQVPLPRDVVREVHRSRTPWLQGCLVALVSFPVRLLKRLSRKLLYVLTVKEATDRLNAYWHRAFLLDYMIRRGDLDDLVTAVPALRALEATVKAQAQSPMTQLAGQVLQGAHHVLRTIFRWLRRRQEDDVAQQARATMAANWADFAAYLDEVARQYEQALRQETA